MHVAVALTAEVDSDLGILELPTGSAQVRCSLSSRFLDRGQDVEIELLGDGRGPCADCCQDEFGDGLSSSAGSARSGGRLSFCNLASGPYLLSFLPAPGEGMAAGGLSMGIMGWDPPTGTEPFDEFRERLPDDRLVPAFEAPEYDRVWRSVERHPENR